jgi:flagellar hook-basal body complex protein FliE
MEFDNIGIDRLKSVLESNSLERMLELRPAEAGKTQATQKDGDKTVSFADTLKQSISEINNLQLESGKAIEDLSTGESTDIQGTIMALEKANISFKVMMEVRNKIVSAYQEVMRTTV